MIPADLQTGSDGDQGQFANEASKDAGLIEVLGLPFQDWPLERVAGSIVADAGSNVTRQVYFMNAHCVNTAARNADYARVVAAEPWLYADGAGMELAAKIEGKHFQHNVNGTDLFPVICAEAAQKDVPIGLLGARPGIAEHCAENMRAANPGLNVAFVEHGFTPAHDDEAVCTRISKSGAKILFVAKGVPLQELWLAANRSQIACPVVIGVGALFDFYSGEMPRAPEIVRRLRCEWLFRLAMEPRRMFGRYILGNPEFVYRALKYKVSGRRVLVN